MLNKLKNRNQSGFTIIEVMIVLAIAALILLIVLLAVPALQRSSRNTAIKDDAAAIAGAVSEYASNNGGSLPLVATQGTGANSGTVTLCDAGTCTTTPATAKVQGSDTVNYETATTTKTTATAAKYNQPGTIDVVFKAACGSPTGAAVTYSSRSSAIVYEVETSGTAGIQCLSS